MSPREGSSADRERCVDSSPRPTRTTPRLSSFEERDAPRLIEVTPSVPARLLRPLPPAAPSRCGCARTRVAHRSARSARRPPHRASSFDCSRSASIFGPSAASGSAMSACTASPSSQSSSSERAAWPDCSSCHRLTSPSRTASRSFSLSPGQVLRRRSPVDAAALPAFALQRHRPDAQGRARSSTVARGGAPRDTRYRRPSLLSNWRG